MFVVYVENFCVELVGVRNTSEFLFSSPWPFFPSPSISPIEKDTSTFVIFYFALIISTFLVRETMWYLKLNLYKSPLFLLLYLFIPGPSFQTPSLGRGQFWYRSPGALKLNASFKILEYLFLFLFEWFMLWQIIYNKLYKLQIQGKKNAMGSPFKASLSQSEHCCWGRLQAPPDPARV